MANDDGVSVFESVRPRLFGIAYRILGSAAEAEDIVQDAWLRWQGTDRSAVVDPSAFLATATTRLAITFAQSAQSRRETYIGSWLPEPVDTSGDPRLGAERAEALEFAVLLLLEKLSPTERAAYVLREAFEYSYDQIAHTIRSTEANARQLVTRARKHISDGRRKSVSSREQQRLLNAFVVGLTERRSSCSGKAICLRRCFIRRWWWRRTRSTASCYWSGSRGELLCFGRVVHG